MYTHRVDFKSPGLTQGLILHRFRKTPPSECILTETTEIHVSRVPEANKSITGHPLRHVYDVMLWFASIPLRGSVSDTDGEYFFKVA
eukprot:4583640-Pyramimonas_sp.AAC.1